MGVGVYPAALVSGGSTVPSESYVGLVLNDNWTGPATASGYCQSLTQDNTDNYACPVEIPNNSLDTWCTGTYTLDQYAECELTHFNYNDFWLSIWSVGAPNSAANCDITSDPWSWYCVGYTAGYNAASEMVWAAEHDAQGQAGAYLPSYAILDPEGCATGTCFVTASPSTSEFNAMIKGWGAGIRANSLLISPAYYYSQSNIAGVLPYGEPYAVFPAVDLASYTLNSTDQGSSAVAGYQAWNDACTGNKSDPNVGIVESWGKAYNFVQFQDSGVDCKP